MPPRVDKQARVWCRSTVKVTDANAIGQLLLVNLFLGFFVCFSSVQLVKGIHSNTSKIVVILVNPKMLQ